MSKRVLMPLPLSDFDPTESGVPFRALLDAGHEVVFATPDGSEASADPRVVTGRGFGPLAPFLRADVRGRAAYEAMVASPSFKAPVTFEAASAADYDALVLPGGHAPGMRPYLESEDIYRLAREFLAANKPIAAICHGVLCLARAQTEGGRSILYGRRVTALLKSQEMLAWGATALWLGSYYRTYPTSVQTEVTRTLAEPAHFETGPMSLRRDDAEHLDAGFAVRDGNLVTSRWPGDAHRLAHELVQMLKG